MRDLSRDNFGLLIAYLVPGFVVLWGLRPYAGDIQSWLGRSSTEAPTIGGFLYGTLASTAAGLFVSAIRWAVVDRLYHATGIPEPRWNFDKLSRRLPAFEALVEYHYRYYQFYANMLVALMFASSVTLTQEGHLPVPGALGVGTVCFLLGVLVAGSRDALRKYYTRVAMLMD